MNAAFWRSPKPATQYAPPVHIRTPEMMYRVAEPGITDDISLPELLDTFVSGFEDQLTARISHLALDVHQTFVVEPIRLLFRGPERTRTWQRAWKIVSSHEVLLRVTVDVDENEPQVVRGCVNSSVVAEGGLGQAEPETSQHLSGRTTYFRERLLAGAHAAMDGNALVARRRADLIGRQAPAIQLMREEMERTAKPEPLF
jgi:hypothetical protein